MKKLLLFLFAILININTFAGGDWATSAISVSQNGGSAYNYRVYSEAGWTNGTWNTNEVFNNKDFGTVTSLILNGGAGNAWADGGDYYTAASFVIYYRAYLQSGSAGAWNSITLDNLSYSSGNNRIYDKYNANIDVLALVSNVPGDYYLEVVMSKNQFYSGGNWNSMIPGGQSTPYNSSTAGYKATFKIEPPLPVELTSFSAASGKNGVNLSWSTSNEVNNLGFEIQKSFNKSEWSKIAFVCGSGNSNSGKSYSFVDANNANGRVYYRLKQVDVDGSYSFSKEVEVESAVIKDFALMQNYPNPFNPSTTISYQVPVNSFVTIKVYNLLGKEVATLVNENKNSGSYTVNFNAFNLSTGVYLYKMTAGNFTSTKKLTLVK